MYGDEFSRLETLVVPTGCGEESARRTAAFAGIRSMEAGVGIAVTPHRFLGGGTK